MLALELDKTAVKPFMGQLLRDPLFDSFEVRSVEIITNIRTSIDGQLEGETPEADAPPQKPGFITWEALRPLVYAIIKTSPKPRYIKVVFSYKAAVACDIHSNAAALFLNLAYENDGVHFTTGTAQREFVFEKTLDSAWDEWVQGFFVKNNLMVTERE